MLMVDFGANDLLTVSPLGTFHTGFKGAPPAWAGNAKSSSGIA